MTKRFAIAAVLAVASPGLVQAASREAIDVLVEKHAKAHNLPSWVVHRVIKRESNYNPSAKGGSALGLMQIKHATARGVGYRGDASGLYDADTNLKYAVAYLAGAWRISGGNYDVCYRHYQRGYYYSAKRSKLPPVMAIDGPATPVPAPASNFSIASLFGIRPATPAPAAGPAGATTPAQVAAADIPTQSRRRLASRTKAERMALARKESPDATPAQAAEPSVAEATSSIAATPAPSAVAPAEPTTATIPAAPIASSTPAPASATVAAAPTAPAATTSLFAAPLAASARPTPAPVRQATAAPSE